MGVHKNISFGRFPKQGEWLGKKVNVCFNYDTSRTVEGTVVRDDDEEPWETLIQLKTGQIFRSVECQHDSPK